MMSCDVTQYKMTSNHDSNGPSSYCHIYLSSSLFTSCETIQLGDKRKRVSRAEIGTDGENGAMLIDAFDWSQKNPH